MKPEHLKLLRDRFWRLNNLYFITDKQGKKVRFRMTQEQVDYFQGMHTRNIILKARQLGFTTLVCIVQLDAALFEAAKCALIAHTLSDAKRLFREKVKYAYDHLPKEIKAANPARNDAAGELVFSKGGSLYVSTSFRGARCATCTFPSSGRSAPSSRTRRGRSSPVRSRLWPLSAS